VETITRVLEDAVRIARRAMEELYQDRLDRLERQVETLERLVVRQMAGLPPQAEEEKS
jgi:hypothetical protein